MIRLVLLKIENHRVFASVCSWQLEIQQKTTRGDKEGLGHQLSHRLEHRTMWIFSTVNVTTRTKRVSYENSKVQGISI